MAACARWTEWRDIKEGAIDDKWGLKFEENMSSRMGPRFMDGMVVMSLQSGNKGPGL